MTTWPSSPSASVRSSQIVAINNPGGFTGGPQGPTVPHPCIHLLGINITLGEDNLPYWYLLLVMIVIVLVLFYRLEGSRIGRAWAAIREDEVAAQATGVNTMRVKLLAFAIGASTSALAGVVLRHPGRLLRPDRCSPCRPRSSSSPTSCSAAWVRCRARWPARRC